MHGKYRNNRDDTVMLGYKGEMVKRFRKCGPVAPVKVLCRNGVMLDTPEIINYTVSDQIATRLREQAPLSERLLVKEMTELGFVHSYPICGFFCDFFHPKLQLDIEIDGPQHRTPEHRLHDVRRAKSMNKVGVKTYRFTCRQVYTDLEAVLANVRDIITLHTCFR